MGELGELRNRVDQAVERLSTTNETRRRQSRGLMTLLTDLEGKYQARSEELEHSKRRIGALTRDNAELSSLVDKLVRIVDTTVTGDGEDTLKLASDMAAELAAGWAGPDVGDAPATDATTGSEAIDDAHGPAAAAAEEEIEAIAAAEIVLDEIAPADDQPMDDVAGETGADAVDDGFAGVAPDLRFEDVSEHELAGERLDVDPDDLAALLDAPLPDPADDPAATMAAVSEGSFEVISGAADDAEKLLDTAAFDAVETDLSETDITVLDDAGEPDPIQEMLAADLDIPEIAFDDDEPISRIDAGEDTESSIRAMMARLEEAAARAKARADDVAETETDEAPAVAAVGGS